MAERGRPRSFDREKALASATEVFWRKGYEGASMTDLAKAMGIVSPSLYAAFASKEGLFHESLDHYSATAGAMVWDLLSQGGTAFEAVRGLLLRTADHFTRPDKPHGCLIALSALQGGEQSPAIRRKLMELRSSKIAEVEVRLRQGVETGEISSRVDLTVIARYFVTVQQGMSIQARDGASREQLEAVAHAALCAWPTLIDGGNRPGLDA